MRVKPRGNIYSINEGNSLYWDEPTTEYINSIKEPESGDPYSLRYVGSMVADVHRTILYGGIFLYPTDKKTKQGKLRVLYETLPMAYIVEMAGGRAIYGEGDVLSIKPKNVHERCGFVCGSTEDVNDYERIYLRHLK